MKPLLWLRYSECVLAVGFHPERLQTKHWEIAAARWEQNSNKWRPGKREDESFMAVQLSYCSEPAHLQSKLKADEPGSRICSAPWALLLLSREMGEGPSASFSWQGLAVLTWGCWEDFSPLDFSMPPQDRFLFCSVAEKPKRGEVNWLLAAKLLIPAEHNPSSSTLCPGKLARKI